MADDLIDNALSAAEAKKWIDQLSIFLDIMYAPANTTVKYPSLERFITETFPVPVQPALLLLPTDYLPSAPLYGLLQGFETDLQFSSQASRYPINYEADLQTYASRVAGTVAELCLELVYHHSRTPTSDSQRQRLIQAGGRMGIALQYVNIARDITVDARIGRVYLPTSWLKADQMSPEDIIKAPESVKAHATRLRLLNKSMDIYRETRGAIEQLPHEAKGPMRVAVESYMEIGRILMENKYKVRAGRATVPKLRRLKVAWQALSR